MGNLLRVVVIVLTSLAMIVAGMLLLVFTACGGLRRSEDVRVMVVCVVVIVIGMGLTAFLALGLDGRRSSDVTTLGLAVPPSIASAPRTHSPARVVLAASPRPPAPGAPPKDS